MQSKYEVIGIVGEGAYGVVYKCKNKETGDFVALKKFKEIDDELVKKTMMRELKVLQMLKHDNIVEYKEAFKRKGDLFLVFEYVDKNLLELLQEHQRGLDLMVIKKLIFQLCKAIKYLHDMNIVHRDIKPENLLVDSTLKLKLCDFGFARTIKKNNEKLTDYVATRWYRSPELLITSGYYGAEVDYWAIGCIMGELVDGDPLFPGDNELDQIAVIQKVLGKLPDNQLELFYNNPNFKGRKLPDVGKPETLERRYHGKMSKQAIAFMKALLNPDPKLRLKGDAVFSHPFFENFQDPFPSTGTNLKITQAHHPINHVSHVNHAVNITHGLSTNSTNANTNRENNINSSIANLNGNINTNTSINADNLMINIKASTNIPLQQEKKQKPVQPIITNTTNINIINYNSYDPKLKMNASTQNLPQPIVIQKKSNLKFEKENFATTQHFKTLSKKTFNEKMLIPNNNLASPGNMVLTSYNFNQNSKKDNLFKMYSSTSFHNNNFKTFYKADPYNFDIDMNFVREKDSEQKVSNNNKNNLLVIDEEKFSSKKQSKFNENILQTNSNAERSPHKIKKKSLVPGKIPNQGQGLNEDLYKILTNRQTNPKITKSNTINKNANSSVIFQLPNITNKNFSLKKLLK